MSPPPDRDPLPTRVQDVSPLPDSYHATLAAGLSEIAGAALSAAELDRIAGHARLLRAWNEAINLTAVRDPEGIAREHVLDSLTALPILREARVSEVLDLGSGGGFPGLPLAIALPARHALLVESVGKKARFLSTVVDALGLADRVRVAATRAETLAADPHHRGRWPAVVARAVTDLSELAELSLPLLQVGGALVAWKREPIEAEAGRAHPALSKLGGRLVACRKVTVPGLEDHVLAVVEKVAETPANFPRDPAARKRKPL